MCSNHSTVAYHVDVPTEWETLTLYRSRGVKLNYTSPPEYWKKQEE